MASFDEKALQGFGGGLWFGGFPAAYLLGFGLIWADTELWNTNWFGGPPEGVQAVIAVLDLPLTVSLSIISEFCAFHDQRPPMNKPPNGLQVGGSVVGILAAIYLLGAASLRFMPGGLFADLPEPIFNAVMMIYSPFFSLLEKVGLS